ncbi:hypothetical protein NOR51B_1406 [Luminiphilus syltensis NOR5-1B]|uniref:EthD domain-containing protein n=1 Tax=Luminiphilus syltensis NOR5-1B TaxID=565045 RepID=B8KYK5_9GAMM|nr:hypothetical protein [Luminiphilus syltensis]EED35461.1 hypothetical protein NOR51B_1406 [Luminiphilus syltensis NOR5-1B]
MLKVFGFVRRHPSLSHDEYRCGHVGFHNSYGRRLRNIRGYILNVRVNRLLDEPLGKNAAELVAEKPADFDDYWSGFGQLMFDSLEDYFQGKSPALDKPGPEGLEQDDRVADVGGDLSLLFGHPPIQFQVIEEVLQPVGRPEHKIFKVLQFAKRRSDVSNEMFQRDWTGACGKLSGQVPGLLGMIINFPTSLDVMSGFFAPETGAFDDSEIVRREAFRAGFDAITEYWWVDPDAMASWQSSMRAELREEEKRLFETGFFCEVDETVVVLPDRSEPPCFYHR